MDATPVVTVFLRHRGEVLLLRRSEAVGSDPGRWGTVAGHVEHGDPFASALAEIEEETGLAEHDVSLVRKGASVSVEDQDERRTWEVHPFLFDATSRDIRTNWETAETEWASPTVLLRRDTVPALWTSYRRVAPSIVALTDDTTHGSSYLSRRALEILRDRAGRLAATAPEDIENARSRLVQTAGRLLNARPSMAALANRLHRAMHASQPECAPSTVEQEAHTAISQALDADAAAARRAADHIAGQQVLTLSRSGTVLQALRQAEPAPAVVVPESHPGREGVGVAETLHETGLDVTLIPDTAVAATLGHGIVDTVLMGADTVRPSGAVVNKVGSRGMAIAAHHEEVPVYAVCATDKITLSDDTDLESVPFQSIYEGPVDLRVEAPRFDVTPPSLLNGLITDRDVLPPHAVEAIADELSALRTWMNDSERPN
jgi:translation initiation factor 2B subunit (eIF-2B alpha/beta/delta family)/8-oxo-dGTP pyrophosphatase MutT (NUDIX family)